MCVTRRLKDLWLKTKLYLKCLEMPQLHLLQCNGAQSIKRNFFGYYKACINRRSIWIDYYIKQEPSASRPLILFFWCQNFLLDCSQRCGQLVTRLEWFSGAAGWIPAIATLLALACQILNFFVPPLTDECSGHPISHSHSLLTSN